MSGLSATSCIPGPSFPCAAANELADFLVMPLWHVAGRAVGHIEPASLEAVSSSILGSYARRRRAESGNRLPRPEPHKPRPDYNLHDRRQCLLGSGSVIRRRRLNVRFAGKRTRLSDLRVRALTSATAPPLRSVGRPRPRRPAESEPLAASRRRSIDLDQPKKRGRGADQFSGASHRSRARRSNFAANKKKHLGVSMG
jgi:hypothetical protein